MNVVEEEVPQLNKVLAILGEELYVVVEKALVVLVQMMGVLMRPQYAQNMDTANVILTNQVVLSVALGLAEVEGVVEKEMEVEDQFVEQDRDLAVLDLMMGVPQMRRCVQSMGIANAPHTSQVVQSADLILGEEGQ